MCPRPLKLNVFFVSSSVGLIVQGPGPVRDTYSQRGVSARRFCVNSEMMSAVGVADGTDCILGVVRVLLRGERVCGGESGGGN